LLPYEFRELARATLAIPPAAKTAKPPAKGAYRRLRLCRPRRGALAGLSKMKPRGSQANNWKND